MPVLFLHGGPGGSAASFEVFAPWAERRDLVFFDQLGSATSVPDVEMLRDAPGELWNVERFCREIDAVRAAHDLDEVVLFGHSWGGWLGLDYLCRAFAQAAPDDSDGPGPDAGAVHVGRGVRAAVLADTAPSFAAFSASIGRRIGELSAHDQGVIAEAASSEAAITAGPTYDAAAVEFYARFVVRGHRALAESVLLRQRSTAVFQWMQGADELHADGSLQAWDRTADAAVVTCPVLVPVGEFDHMDPVCAETLATALPAGELAVLPGAGHCPHLEQPDVFVELVRSWIDSRIR